MFSRVSAWAKIVVRTGVAAALAGCGAAAPAAPRAPVDAAPSSPASVQVVDLGHAAKPTAPNPPIESKGDEQGAVSRERPWLGIEMRHEPQGVVIERVLRGSAAAAAGLQPGDVLVTFGDLGIRRPTDLHEALAARSVGDRVSASVRRQGELRLFSVQLSPKPNSDALMQLLYTGAPAPSLSSLTVVSGTVNPSLKGLKGQVVVLEFWASFCSACRAMTPTLNQWHDELRVQGVRLLGITSDPFEEAERAAQHFEIRYPVFVDGSGEVSAAYTALSVPTLFVIDKRGIVRDVMVGFDLSRLTEFERLIRRLAEEPEPS